MAWTWRERGIYLITLSLVLVVLIQATLLNRIRILGVQPDLLLVVVVCWSLLHGLQDGLFWAFVGGLGIDLVAGLPLGASPLALMPAAVLASLGRSSVYASSTRLPVLLVALATPLHGWIILMIRQLLGTSIDWLGATQHVVLPAIVPNAMLAFIVAHLLRRLTARPMATVT